MCDMLLRVLQIPTIGFLYIAGWIGYVGRDYLIAARKESKPREKEYIIDVPQALKMAWQVKHPPLPNIFVNHQHPVLCPTRYGLRNVYSQGIRLMHIPSSPPPKSVPVSLVVCSIVEMAAVVCAGSWLAIQGHQGTAGWHTLGEGLQHHRVSSLSSQGGCGALQLGCGQYLALDRWCRLIHLERDLC